jgi:adenosylcobinamide-GDP ribazoletransferase
MRPFLRYFYIAWTTLTALPMPTVSASAPDTGGYSKTVILFPLVGAIIGLLLFALAHLFRALALPAPFGDILIVLIYYLITGFLHFDGFCDVCDAFFANADAPRRLAILKDSHLGTYALTIGVLALMAKVALVNRLMLVPHGITLLIIVPVWSRLAMVLLAAWGRYPRQEGTGKPFIGRITVQDAALTAGCTLIIVVALAWLCRLGPLLVGLQAFIVAAVTLAMYTWSNRKIGGVTGDVLGAAGEIGDILLLGGSLTLL